VRVATDHRLTEAMPEAIRWGSIMLGHAGSISHGTHDPRPGSIDDVDLFGVAIPDTRHILGLDPWQHWVYKVDELDVVYYSLTKLVTLLLKSNPNVLGLLYLRNPSRGHDHYIETSPEFERLIGLRWAFASKQAHRSFVGYANDQLTKLESGAYKGYMGEKRRALVREFGYDPKNAAHLIRLLRMGIEYLGTGLLYVDRTGIDAEELKAIKRGEWTLDRVKSTASDLFADARQAKEESPLPDEPDRGAAEQYLIDTLLASMC
jgi:predicted nucleotidyltransferase